MAYSDIPEENFRFFRYFSRIRKCWSQATRIDRCTEIRIEIARRIFIIGRRECREGGCVNGKYELFVFAF